MDTTPRKEKYKSSIYLYKNESDQLQSLQHIDELLLKISSIKQKQGKIKWNKQSLNDETERKIEVRHRSITKYKKKHTIKKADGKCSTENSRKCDK